MTDKNFKKGDIIRITERDEMLALTVACIPYNQIWIVDEDFLNRPHEQLMYKLFTLDNDGKLYSDAAYPYAMELVEFPTSEEQELAWHIKSALDKSREKTKLEDMTIRQIRELKQRILVEISAAIEKATSGYDVGVVLIEAETEVYKDACGTPYHWNNNMTIKFSKEDEA